MTDTVCYPQSHLPFYIIGIVFISLIFFMLFWQSTKNFYELNYTANHPVNPPILQQNPRTQNNPDFVPNTMTIGNHSSAHTSAITAAPYIPPAFNPPRSPYLPPLAYPTLPYSVLPNLPVRPAYFY
jgi:hypothetical protein